ncbi:hypothetical protein ACFXP3_32820, partial [Streptomyces sp. NPDC059096]|uniref:hypothetical protein n=1 Tax=Streptomyces sp. NPDC059096 TaxID=3346727 RepID=UPI00367BAA6B
METRTPRRFRPRARWLAGLAAAAVLVGAGTWTAVAAVDGPAGDRVEPVGESPGGRCDTAVSRARARGGRRGRRGGRG